MRKEKEGWRACDGQIEQLAKGLHVEKLLEELSTMNMLAGRKVRTANFQPI